VATLTNRLARLEQQATGGAGGQMVCGVMRVNYDTGTGPDVVKLQPSGEQMTRGEFRRRYPRGLIVVRTEYGPPTDDDLAPA
jgi:hypothetical protein